MSLTKAIILGIVLGIATGIFLGEYAAALDPVGRGFIRLLQMSVLPYITVSLISGFGRLDFRQARTLGLKALSTILMLWSLAFAVILILPLSFPAWESASFFSSSVLETPPPVDFVSLYIPANPFQAMSEAVIPAVVLFSIAVGLALIPMKNKESLLDNLHVLSQALISITRFVVRLTPFGVFAIAAVAAGTMSLAEFGRLQVYLVSYMAASLLLTFALLPMLVTSFTPFTYRQVFAATKDALITGFTTGNLFIILPIIIENLKALFHSGASQDPEGDSVIDVIIPVSFNFPNVGTLLLLLFVLFGAWFSGNALELVEYPRFAVLGLFSFFGSVDVGMPFLLDNLRLPADLFQLYIVTGIIIGRFATLIAIMHLVALAALVASRMTGTLLFSPLRLARYLGISVVLLAATVLGVKVLFQHTVDQSYSKDRVLKRMQLLQTPQSSVVRERVPEEPVRPFNEGESRMDRIRQLGLLRVGYRPDNLPFSHINQAGELVGLDVEMGHQLAKELGVLVEFIPFRSATLAEQLQRDDFDLAMSGIHLLRSLTDDLVFSEPYLDVHTGLVVPDYRRRELDTIAELRREGGLDLAVLETGQHRERVRRYLPLANTHPIDNPEKFFQAPEGTYDALVISAEAGAAWTLIYPEYSVLIPKPLESSLPLGYPVAARDLEFKEVLDGWLLSKVKDGTIKDLYDYWILGRNAERKEPRWSILRNVLGWRSGSPLEESVSQEPGAEL